IEKSPFKERKLDLIGFDACLMGSVETAWQLSDYAELMIASEETEPGGGWDYSFLGGMEKEEITATGRRIIDLYVDTAHQAQGAHLTLSMIDLSKVEGVVEGMDAYFSGLGRSMNENGFQDLSNLRYYAQGFGRDWRVAESTDYDLVDITSLLDAYEDYQPAAADDLRAALQDAIVYHRGTYSESFGLSAYFPYFNGQAYLEKGKAAYEKLNFCPGYTEFIDLFYRRMHAPGRVDWRGLMPSVTREEEGFQISLQLTQAQKEHLVSARLVIFESNFAPGSANAYYDPVYASADTALSAEGLLSAPYRDERLILQFTTENGMSRQAESLPFTVLDTGEYQVEFLASNLIPEFGAAGDRDEPGVSHLMQAILSPPDEAGKLQIRQIRAWDSMTNTFTSRMDDRIENYQYLHFISRLAMITRQDDLILPYWQWQKETSYHPGFINLSYAMARSEWSFEMQRQPADIQFAAFEITDIYNRTFTTELVPVRPVEEMILYKKRFSLPNPRIDINCYLVACSTYQANLIVELTNHTDQTYSFAITDQLLNGKENYRAPDHPSLSQWVIGPGEKGSTFIKYGPEHSYLNEISLSLSLYAGEGGAYLGSTGYLSLKPGMAITQLQERFR
ncbi:MAG: hypothetical protein IJD39_07045, partial [Clostridia bacterium]|nr:hypothetical protein [Clostridia bacterium]